MLVFVQQDAAPFVHAGDEVAIRVDEQPDLCIAAPVNRCAQALDPRTRTMLCEIWLENQNRLYPGTFVHVTFHLAAPRTPVIDSGALVLRNHKPSVAVVRDGRVHFVPVRPGLDDGKTVQIVEGLQRGRRVVLAPPVGARGERRRAARRTATRGRAGRRRRREVGDRRGMRARTLTTRIGRGIAVAICVAWAASRPARTRPRR